MRIRRVVCEPAGQRQYVVKRYNAIVSNVTQNLCHGHGHMGFRGCIRSYGARVLATLTPAKVLCSSRLSRKGHDYQRFPATDSSECRRNCSSAEEPADHKDACSCATSA